MALGARARNVIALVLRRTMRPVVIEAAVGALVAAITSRVLSAALFGVSPLDPIATGGAAAFVIAVALAAGILPGRRAMLAEPTAALREE